MAGQGDDTLYHAVSIVALMGVVYLFAAREKKVVYEYPIQFNYSDMSLID